MLYCPCHGKWHSQDVLLLPRHLHVVTTWRSPDNASRKTRNSTRLKCCTCQTMEVSKVLRLPREIQLIFWKPSTPCADTWACHGAPCLPRLNQPNPRKVNPPHVHAHWVWSRHTCEKSTLFEQNTTCTPPNTAPAQHAGFARSMAHTE